MEKTLILIKPGFRFVLRELAREIRACGLRVESFRVKALTREMVGRLYPHRVGVPRFEDMVLYLTSEPVVIMVVSGEGAVAKVLQIKGKGNTHGLRKKYAPDSLHNVMHSSQTVEEAETEVSIFGKA